MAVIQEEMVTTALIDMLATAVGVPVGDHRAETTEGEPLDTSSGNGAEGLYLVVHRIDGGFVDGSYGDPHQDVTLVYQVDSHGRSRQQAEGLARTVTAAMTDIAAAGGHVNVLAGNGWTGGLRERQTTGRPEHEGTDEQGTGLWTQRERFTVEVHPA